MTVPEGVAAPTERRRRPSRRPVRGRWTAVIVVVALVAGIGLVSAAFPAPAAAPGPGSADGVPVPPAEATSSSAFCPAATGTAAVTTVYLTNSTTRAVAGIMTSVGPVGRHGASTMVHRTVVVPPLGTAAVDPSTGLAKGSNASSFTFAGGGVVANQVVSGPLGWSTAPCASRTATQWAFAGGSTSAGNNLALALFDPAAPASVVNITFLTKSGLVTPQAYQGLVIPPGRLVVENIGAYVQRASDIATFVSAQAGALVSSEFQQTSVGGGGGLSLRLGSPGLSTVWRFAQTTAGVGSAVSFHLANPSTRTVSATIAPGLSSGTVIPRRVSVPPLSIVDFSASGTAGLPHQIPYSLIIDSSGPIVVGRSVFAGGRAPPPAWGSSAGTVTVATRWLIPGPGVYRAPGPRTRPSTAWRWPTRASPRPGSR